MGFEYGVSDIIAGQLITQLNVKNYSCSVVCEVRLWVLDMMFLL